MMLLATIIFAISLLTLVSMFLAKFGQISSRPNIKVRIATATYHHDLWPYFRQKLSAIIDKLWHFILEAKDLAPATSKTIHSQYEKVKSVFRIRIRSSAAEPQWLPEAADLTIKPTFSQNPEQLYLQAIKKNPDDRSAYEHLGRLYLQNKNYADGVQTYEYLTKLDPTKDIYYSNLGLAHYSLKEYQKAVSAYEKALSINNKIPTRWVNLAFSLEALDEYPKAVKALTEALRLDKLNPHYLTLLADAYVKLENNVRAEEVLEQILVLEPTNKPAREKLMKLKI